MSLKKNIESNSSNDSKQWDEKQCHHLKDNFGRLCLFVLYTVVTHFAHAFLKPSKYVICPCVLPRGIKWNYNNVYVLSSEFYVLSWSAQWIDAWALDAQYILYIGVSYHYLFYKICDTRFEAYFIMYFTALNRLFFKTSFINYHCKN